MSLPLTINGVIFNYPEQGDSDWGQQATAWAQAISGGLLQKSGGLFTLTNEVDFGGGFGIKSIYYKTRSSNISTTGQFRLSASDVISYRNNANSANLDLGIDGSDRLTFNGGIIPIGFNVVDTSKIDLNLTFDNTLSANIVPGSLVNADISNSAAIAYSKLNLSGAIVNADIASAAAIAFTKMETLSGAIVPVTDAGGKIISSAVTSNDLAQLNGITSNIQTQLNAKLNLAGGTMSGALILNADPVTALGAATKQYADAVGQGLSVHDSVQLATTANITLSGEQTIDGVMTSASRVLVKNQSTQANNGVYVSAAGAWTRATDSDTWSELVRAYYFVTAGTSNASSGWFCTASLPGTINVDPVIFTQFSAAGTYQADGQGIELTGNTFSLELDGTTLSKSGSGLKVNLIANAQIAAAAAIAVNKLAALTASRAVVTDGSGFLTPATTTATEIGYINGVTSSIQTQLNARVTNPMTTDGDMIYQASGIPARIPLGAEGQVLAIDSGIPKWITSSNNPPLVSVSTNIILTAADSNTVYLVDTSVARTFTLPTPATGLSFIIKDALGTCDVNNITLIRAGSEKIEGILANKLLQTNWGAWRVISNGVDWFLI